MFDEFDKYILAFTSEDAATDYWYDEGFGIAENMLDEFDDKDWKNLFNTIPQRSIEWKKRLAYCMHDGNNLNQFRVLLNFLETDDDELLEFVVDSLRGFPINENTKLIRFRSQIVSRIEEVRPKVGNVARRVFDEFTKVLFSQDQNGSN